MRGVYENPADSGIWWIHYYADGKRHRVLQHLPYRISRKPKLPGYRPLTLPVN